MTIKHFALTAALLLTTASAQAAILTGVDILNLTGVTESSLTAPNMTQARATLTDEGANITDVAIGSFTAANLVGIDILYVGLTFNGFTAAQVDVIGDYVRGGGGIVAVGTERACCFGAPWEQIIRELGFTGLGGDRAAKPNPTNPSSPIVDGPFGTADTYAPAATGAFDPSSLPAGTDIVWEGVDNNPIIVTLDTGGRAFFFADTNFMQNFYIGDGDNQIIWGNAFAFAGFVDPDPTPAPAALALFGLGALALGLRRR